MRRIYKYPLETTDRQYIRMPSNPQVLTVQTQRGAPYVWALVDDEREWVTVGFRTFGTGHPFDAEGYTYLGTYQLMAGDLVFHVFVESWAVGIR